LPEAIPSEKSFRETQSIIFSHVAALVKLQDMGTLPPLLDHARGYDFNDFSAYLEIKIMRSSTGALILINSITNS
jgi:hypothetical protein